MAFLAQHPAVVDFLDLMSIVPDLRLEQILVQPGSILDGTILAIRRASGIARLPGPEVDLGAGDRVVVLGSLSSLDAMGVSVCPTAVPKKHRMIMEGRGCRRRQARFRLGAGQPTERGSGAHPGSGWPTR